ncbi:MAG: MMPL family transporter [Candidatus Aenigmatarchaeota archaeon]
MVKSLLKEWKVWAVIVAVSLSIISLSPNPWAKGVVVENVEDNSPLNGKISPGEKIDSINEQPIESPEDLYKFENYTGMLRIVHNGDVSLAEMKGQELGLEVGNSEKINLEFGMDFQGGIRVLLAPKLENVTNTSQKNEMVNQILSRLKTRMNVYGLKEMNFQEVTSVTGEKYVRIEMAGASREDIDELLKRKGKFESYIPLDIGFENKTGEVALADKTYEIGLDNNSITYQGKSYDVNDTLSIGGISFDVWNITSNKTVLAGKVFSSEQNDITHVSFTGRNVQVQPTGNGYQFRFEIIVSQKAAERFARITSNIPVTMSPISTGDGQGHLKSKIYLFLDDKLASSPLQIASSLRGRAYTTPVITGGGNTEEEAKQEMRRLQSILESGELPAEVETVKVDRISGSLGGQFLQSVVLAGLGALLAVISIIYIRYRRKEIMIPMITISICEIVIILGVASLIKWTIDLAAIAGIIAAIGTGVDDQIIIADETIRGNRKKKKARFGIGRRVKRAFFIVLGAAATTIAAMMPLMIIGIGVMRGFAITTIIGVLVGIAITRPAYGKILEKVT